MRLARRALGLVLGCATGMALGQSAGGEFVVKKSVVAGGSATADGGTFRSAATVGQPDAGRMDGGDFRVSGGFWPESSNSTPPQDDEIFGNGFEGS